MNRGGTDRWVDSEGGAGIVGGGVSGGACVDRSRTVLSEDLLSPVLASAVFPDLAQRFLLVPIGVLDRARALEKSLERAFGVIGGKAAGANAMRESLFRPRATNAARTAPLLLLNTTSVETGRRVVLSPVRWADAPPGRERCFWTTSRRALTCA